MNSKPIWYNAWYMDWTLDVSRSKSIRESCHHSVSHHSKGRHSVPSFKGPPLDGPPGGGIYFNLIWFVIQSRITILQTIQHVNGGQQGEEMDEIVGSDCISCLSIGCCRSMLCISSTVLNHLFTPQSFIAILSILPIDGLLDHFLTICWLLGHP